MCNSTLKELAIAFFALAMSAMSGLFTLFSDNPFLISFLIFFFLLIAIYCAVKWNRST